MDTKLQLLINDVVAELDRAVGLYGEFNSAHEGYAVILEELDELKEEVWLKQSLRSKDRMRAEAIQIAAMAIKFAHGLC